MRWTAALLLLVSCGSNSSGGSNPEHAVDDAVGNLKQHGYCAIVGMHQCGQFCIDGDGTCCEPDAGIWYRGDAGEDEVIADKTGARIVCTMNRRTLWDAGR